MATYIAMKFIINSNTCIVQSNIFRIEQWKISHYFSQDPEPLPYLKHEDKYNYDINLEVLLKGKR